MLDDTESFFPVDQAWSSDGVDSGMISQSAQLLDGKVAKLGRGLVPGQCRDPTQTGLVQSERVGQSGRTLVEHDGHRIASDLSTVEKLQDASERDVEFAGVANVARIDMMTEREAVNTIEDERQAHLAQVMASLLVVTVLSQIFLFVGGGDEVIVVGGVVAEQAGDDHMPAVPQRK